MNRELAMSGIDGEEPPSDIRKFVNKALAMSGMDGEEPPSEFFVDPSHSVNNINEDDDWVIVKKQRITVLIPPPSPGTASPQAGTSKISYRQTSLPRMSRRNCCVARKKHPKQLTTKKSQDLSVQATELDVSSKKAQADPSESLVHQVDARMRGESLHSPVAPAVKSEWTTHANHDVQGLFHQDTEKATTSPFGQISELSLPVISSNVTNKVLRARLLQRRAAGFGGLRNLFFTCGFGWFVKILDSEKLGMYQIASLTMNQLKEMGFTAVGPRRKLIHAIDSLCQPCQFEMFS